jgi:biopolymer transport protein ExbB/TolQ
MSPKRKKSRDVLEQVAVGATRWVGSTDSLFIHTAIFIIAFILYFFGIAIDKILLVLTTIVSLEAIYLSIFIQMSVNRQAHKLHAVARDVDEIQEDVEDIQEDVEDIQENVDEIQEDVEDIQEEDEVEEKEEKEEDETLTRIEKTLGLLISEIAELKKENEVKK